ncbi:MAG: hypothetical protein M1816_003681 [Peltula sp. TS41687]|nr:MAG: hypothetical protein M1816_003681 [Peltula sp. TS41687]
MLVHGIVAAVGVASHLGYFHHGEHHMYGLRYIQLFFTFCAVATVVLVQAGNRPIGEACVNAFTLVACYLAGVYTSLLTYRVFFSPLKRFPGPYAARLSSLWWSAQLTDHDAYKKVLSLHQKHGDFVRIGSNDLSIIHPKAVSAIYGVGSRCIKSDWYEQNRPVISMQTTRDRAIHDQRRRIWSAAFSDKAIRTHEEKIKVYQDKLMAHIAAFDDEKVVNVAKWFSLYSFDVMGVIGFGEPFGVLDSSGRHWAVKLWSEAFELLSYIFPAWFFRILVSMPKVSNDWWKFLEYCNRMLDERRKAKVSSPDIISTLLEPWKDKELTRSELMILEGDAQLVIAAGSDTTATTLTYTIYELARHPEHLPKLYAEITPHARSSGEVAHQNLQYLNHLNGVINEALRLHPPIPTALQRLTPPEGLDIGDTHIPGNVTVWCPQYAIGRSENAYTDANAFIPERWYSRPEMIKEKTAFAPFSTGPYNCIGRPLALMNLRTTLAKLLLTFDFELAPGETGASIENAKDHFALVPEELNVVFRRKKMLA